MPEREINYLERRAADHTLLAQQADHRGVVSSHYTLSKLYFERADTIRQMMQMPVAVAHG